MKNQRFRFSFPADTTYLNCAYMSPLMKQVEKAGVRGIHRKSNPQKILAEDFFTETEVLRQEFARLIRVKDPRRIVVIPSASYGLSSVARNIHVGKGDSIVINHEQFPSNVYPWMRLASDTGASVQVVSPPERLQDRGKIWNERLLEAIKSDTKIVAIGQVHWADGTLYNLEQVRKRANEVGAKLIIDGTQSVGAFPFDASKIQPDALVCAGYKWLMGPYSIGLAYFNDSFDEGVPLEENWINRAGSEDFAGLVEYASNYQDGALRYEVGEHSNFILIPMLIEALKQVNQWDQREIQSYCKSIAQAAIKTLRDRGCWIEEEAWRGSHLFGIRLPKQASLEKIKQKARKRKISISFRGEALRVSPHVYNTKEDLEKLVEIIV